MSAYETLRRDLEREGIECDATHETRNAYATDESVFSVMPKLVVFPKTADEVRVIVSKAQQARGEDKGISLTARAAGTGLSGGSLNDSVVIDVCRYLTELRPLETSADEGAYVRAQPGVLFRDFDAHTKHRGYFMPSYPSSRDICTIGGMIANNAAGPFSLKYGHTANFVHALDVVLHDANVYTVTACTYAQLEKELERKDALGDMYRAVWDLIERHRDTIREGKPSASKNSSGYALWDVLSIDSIEDFKGGAGMFSLIPLFAGSQGTLGIITDTQCRVIPVTEMSDLLVVPVARTEDIGVLIETVLTHHPCNVEIFDDRTYTLAKKNLHFFKKRFYPDNWRAYIRFVWNFVVAYIRVFRLRTPAFVLLITFDAATCDNANTAVNPTVDSLKEKGFTARRVTHAGEREMLWNIRYASYSLAKLGKKNRRPAAFLEDMVIRPEKLAAFLKELTDLLQVYKAEYAMHGHGGNGHFHFYPLLDFTDPKTPGTIKRMADDFFALAKKYDGDICGEHNDGIIRTPYMKQMFSEEMLSFFEKLEHASDPMDIFNPGKKVHPKFDIIDSIRTTN